MGAEARCTLTVGTQSSIGKALLETEELIFHGDFRLKILLKDISSVDVSAGTLRLAHSAGVATLALGEATAAKWAEKIRNPKGLFDKLGLKSGQRVVVLGAVDAAFAAQIRECMADVSFGRARKAADALFLAAHDLRDLDRLSKLRTYIKPSGAIWTITPKGKGGIKDGDIIAAGRAAGLVDVKVVSFSDTHSANRFVIPKVQR